MKFEQLVFTIQQRLNESQSIQNQLFTIWQSVIAKFSSMPDNPLQVPAHKLISKLSYTHLVQLLPIESAIKRTFYEIEAIKGNWNVSEKPLGRLQNII